MATPDVIVILADDMGFSDIGCYGGEIRTPNLDRLARDGVRFSQFYSSPRCSPSRASLLTGLHPHQTGIGVLTNDDRPRGYPGTLNDRCVTAAEVLHDAGYATCLAGKWHLAANTREPNDAWPTRRGFEHFYGTLTGCGSFFQPGTLKRGEADAEHEALDPAFYYTDAITDEACAFVRRHHDAHRERPFFLYCAYTAPHWPLHALPDDIERYDGVFDDGWDALRARRLERLRRAGIVRSSTALSAPDPLVTRWDDADDPAWQVARMKAYAAQVDRMDQGIGRLLATLEERGRLANALILFLSDNGACAESLPQGDLAGFKERRDILRLTTRDGREVRIGNDPSIVPGGEDTYASYGRAWANLSNTPFRLYKRWVHEGGIATPLIAHWPHGGLAAGSVVHVPFQLTDVLPTLAEASGATYPAEFGGRPILPPEGRSMMAALRGDDVGSVPLYWEHLGNAAVRDGRWKLVREYGMPWELYDIALDRSESDDVAAVHADVVAALAAKWRAWAARVGVVPWDVVLDIYRERGRPAREAAG